MVDGGERFIYAIFWDGLAVGRLMRDLVAAARLGAVGYLVPGDFAGAYGGARPLSGGFVHHMTGVGLVS